MAKKLDWESSYYSQPAQKEMKRNAAQATKKASAKGKQQCPVVITGRTISKSWWGKAWCKNLERYADFESRLSRGARYVRSGAVVDLQIQEGKILARVQGSRKTPYKTEILITPLSRIRCGQIVDRCSARVSTIENLLNGTFPETMKDIFLERDGLFPTPREISFHCSCPDWAVMCKHIAAVLYGIAVRLDEDPMLFFSLRGIETDRFVDVIIANRVERMLSNADRPSSRIISDMELGDLFGIDTKFN